MLNLVKNLGHNVDGDTIVFFLNYRKYVATERNYVICVEGTLDCVKGMTMKPCAMVHQIVGPVSQTMVLVFQIMLSVPPG